MASEDSAQSVTRKAIKEVQTFVRLIFFTLTKFYNLNLKTTDLKKDLLINIVTNFTLRDRVYFTLHNLVTKVLSDRVKAIQRGLLAL